MSAVPDSLRILASLRTLDEHGFARLIQARRVNARSVEDLLDLAEWLEAPANVAAALGRLDWPTLRGLRLGDRDALARAAELELAVGEGDRLELLPEVERQLRALLPTVPSYTTLVRESGASAGGGEAAGTASANQIAQLANDALWLLAAEPRGVRITREQARLSGVEIRRLANELDTDSAVVGSLYRWLHTADLVAPSGEVWHLTGAGAAFVSRPVVERWRILVEAWLAELTCENLTSLLDLLGQDAAEQVVGFDEDADDTSALALPGNLAAQLASAAALGLVGRGALTLLGGLVLDTDLLAAVEVLARHRPEEISKVYLQPDQTILAPGPLAGELDRRLRVVADLERRALASEYRLTPASITRALNEGMTEAEIRDFLAEVSLTGIPQPVDYLLSNTAASHGRVRVLEYDRTIGQSTRITTENPELRDALEVDTALGTLGLRRLGEDLVSRVAPQVVLAALLEAHYPAVLEGSDGTPIARSQQRLVEPQRPAPGPTAARTAAELAAQAAAGDHADDRMTWLQRRLEIARRTKAELHVTIEVPGSDPVVLELIPLSVGAQRLRALDLEADVERTLPMRAILSIEDA